ncbi:MAG TPA: EAL domain-containing protein [Kineosporiaceae bacterium]|nr:EAL domain-containing protein [Kineosporiaceae bacterium]
MSGPTVADEVLAARVLVVDDEPGNVLLLTRHLQRAGFVHVEGVTDARWALPRFREWRPDIVLLDLAMPYRDGFTVLRDLRSEASGEEFLPVVVLTADTSPDSRLRALREGANDFIVKPFRAEEVLLRVRNLLATRVLHLRLQEHNEQLARLVAERTRDLDAERQFLQAVLDCLEEGIVACDADGRLRFANPAAARLGVQPATGTTLPGLVPGQLHACDGSALSPDEDPLRRAFTGYRVVGQELLVRGPGDDPRTVVANGRPIVSDPGDRLGAVVALQDVTDRRRVEEELRRRVLHDQLTGLPNRVLFLDRLGVALARAERDHRPLAVLLLNVDHFAGINDTLGHEAGDALLTALAERIRTALRPGDSGARFAGDEFAVLCEPPVGESTARRIAERIRSALSVPVEVSGRWITPELSIGIAVQRDAGRSAEEVLQDAHAAVFHAKQRGGGRYEIFESSQRQQLLERLDVEAALRHALAEGQLRLYYQPTVDLRTGEVVGAEALVRWQRPGEGLLSPLRFIPIAEQTGLIARVGQWVLRAACTQLALWQQTPLLGDGFTLSVNLSAREVGTAGLVELVDDVLAGTKADPRRLCLEITETALVHDPDRAAATLRALRERGLRIAVDDFGTGQSSLTYLQRFPIGVLKVDRSFVASMVTNRNDAEIVAAVIDLGRRLDLVTVAEGVETDQQAAALVALGCQLAQGYYFSAAVPAERLAAQLGRAGNAG